MLGLVARGCRLLVVGCWVVVLIVKVFEEDGRGLWLKKEMEER